MLATAAEATASLDVEVEENVVDTGDSPGIATTGASPEPDEPATGDSDSDESDADADESGERSAMDCPDMLIEFSPELVCVLRSAPDPSGSPATVVPASGTGAAVASGAAASESLFSIVTDTAAGSVLLGAALTSFMVCSR